MEDPKTTFEKAMASLIEGKRGLGGAPADARSALVGACLLALERMLSEAIRVKSVDAFVDVLAWQLAVMGTQGGPAAIADVVGRLEGHLGRLAAWDAEEGGQEPDGNPEPRTH
jgi:hypothetical protein